MTDEKGKTPLQASGAGRPKTTAEDGTVGTSHGRTESESQGGAYPNPHSDKEAAGETESFHGGQSKVAHHGTGQHGDEEVEEQRDEDPANRPG